MSSAHRWSMLAGFGACVLTVAALSRPPTRIQGTEHRPPLLPRIELLMVAGNGYRQLLADYYWVLMTHTAGGARTEQAYLDVYHYADFITDLDPGFNYVYRFAGTVVPFNRGRETWVNTDASTRILEKGLSRFPSDVSMRTIYAYNLSYFHEQYEKAAAQLAETARLPGAPPYLGPLATRLYAQAGKLDAGLMLAATLADQARDEEERETFEQRMLHLRLEGELRKVDAAAKALKERTGAAPTQLLEVLVSGELREFPIDPFGGAIIISPDGRASSTAQGERLQVYLPRSRRSK